MYPKYELLESFGYITLKTKVQLNIENGQLVSVNRQPWNFNVLILEQ